jgi:hypothetical protein
MQSNPKRQTAARILFLFAILFLGAILITAHWEKNRGTLEWHTYPSALGDEDYVAGPRQGVEAVIGGKKVVLDIKGTTIPLQDRWQYQVGTITGQPSRVYAEWTSARAPGKAGIPEPSVEFFVKAGRNSYHKATLKDSPPP